LPAEPKVELEEASTPSEQEAKNATSPWEDLSKPEAKPAPVEKAEETPVEPSKPQRIGKPVVPKSLLTPEKPAEPVKTDEPQIEKEVPSTPSEPAAKNVTKPWEQISKEARSEPPAMSLSKTEAESP